MPQYKIQVYACKTINETTHPSLEELISPYQPTTFPVLKTQDELERLQYLGGTVSQQPSESVELPLTS